LKEKRWDKEGGKTCNGKYILASQADAYNDGMSLDEWEAI
jgi:hypothetical protein